MLAIAILLVVLGSLYLLMVAPMLDRYSGRGKDLGDRRSKVSHLSAAAERLPALDVLDAQVADLRKLESASQTTLKGANDQFVKADLRIRIGELAASAGATIGSMDELGAENAGDYRRIGLRIAANGPYDAIVKLLSAIEKGTPSLVLNNLQINGPGQQPSGPAQPSGPPSGARIDAAFEVYGFRSAEASPPLKQ